MPRSKEAHKKYRHSDKGRATRNKNAKLYYRRPVGRASRLYHRAKVRAKSKGVELTIDLEWVKNRINVGVCEATGCMFDLEHGEDTPYSPSIDRIDSSKGYTKDNCRMVIWGFNCGKNGWSDEEFYKWSKCFISKYEEKNGIVPSPPEKKIEKQKIELPPPGFSKKPPVENKIVDKGSLEYRKAMLNSPRSFGK